MREITISDGTKFVINPLRGKDVREIDVMQRDEKVPTVDTIFETLKRGGIKEKQFDEMLFPDIVTLNKAILAETYGVEEEIKN